AAAVRSGALTPTLSHRERVQTPKKATDVAVLRLPPFRPFLTVFHISSIFPLRRLTKLVSFPEVFQDENV
ncbi:hypothetical protein, partial [Enterobacter mori]